MNAPWVLNFDKVCCKMQLSLRRNALAEGLPVVPAFKDAVWRSSLQGKITLGYYAVAAIILVVSLFFVGELRTLEERVVRGQRASDLFDTALEIRRFERNYFLHHQAADRAENGRYIDHARALLTDRSEEHTSELQSPKE